MQDLKWQTSSNVMVNKKNVRNVITPIGELEISEWMKKVEELAIENKEEDILGKIYQYCRKELAWLKMKEFPLPENIEELGEDEAKQVIIENEKQKKKYKDKLERDIKQIALQYYAARIWETTDWVGYELFKKNYIQETKQLTIQEGDHDI